jgi:hypothetical protein
MTMNLNTIAQVKEPDIWGPFVHRKVVPEPETYGLIFLLITMSIIMLFQARKKKGPMDY